MEKLTGLQLVARSRAQELLWILFNFDKESLHIEGNALYLAGFCEESYYMAVSQKELVANAVGPCHRFENSSLKAFDLHNQLCPRAHISSPLSRRDRWMGRSLDGGGLPHFSITRKKLKKIALPKFRGSTFPKV